MLEGTSPPPSTHNAPLCRYLLLTIRHVPLKVVHKAQKQRHVTGRVVVHICNVDRGVPAIAGEPSALTEAVWEGPEKAQRSAMSDKRLHWPCYQCVG
jgi:hypothetical protein